MKSYINVTISEGVALVMLNDPPKRNALSQPMAKQLLEVIERVRFDPEVKVIVLRGAEGFFCAGGDIVGMKQRTDSFAKGERPEAELRANMATLNQMILSVRRVEKPVVAWIEGACAGGGMSLAMACDYAFAADDVKLCFAFVGVGLAPDMGSTLMILRRVGPTRATELLLSGRRFSAAEAETLSIITKAVPPEMLEETVRKQVKQLVDGPSLVYAEIKSAVNRILYPDIHQCMNLETEAAERLSHTEDHKEAVEAFLEKRKPVFTGK